LPRRSGQAFIIMKKTGTLGEGDLDALVERIAGGLFVPVAPQTPLSHSGNACVTMIACPLRRPEPRNVVAM
jgi:hypothetical protein